MAKRGDSFFIKLSVLSGLGQFKNPLILPRKGDMVSNSNNLNSCEEKKELWQSISELCRSQRVILDLFTIQQERIIHLENLLGSSAVLPKRVSYEI
jgi:hypothetical protein